MKDNKPSGETNLTELLNHWQHDKSSVYIYQEIEWKPEERQRQKQRERERE